MYYLRIRHHAAVGQCRLSDINVDVTVVRLALAQLRYSAAGPDNLSPIFFKRLEPLTIVYQQSIYQAQILHAWRQATVIALYKGKGEKIDPPSYYGISLRSVASKILEHIVEEQVCNLLINNSLIGEEQHGYKPKRSVATNLV